MNLDNPRRRVRRAAVAASLSAVILAGGLAACTSASPDAAESSPSTGGVYRLPISDPGTEIEPQNVEDYNAQLIVGLASEGLIAQDKDGNLLPRLAVAWEPDDDGTTWTVDLREGAEFNDGSPVTADDVVTTFSNLIAPDSTSPGKSSLEPYLESVTAADDETVEFHLSQPYSDFPLLLTGANTAILPADYEPGTWLDNPVGAGQFILESYTVGTGATYTKNPNYWGADDILLDGIELKVYADTQAEILAFQAGEIDQIDPTPEVLSVIDADDYRLIDNGYQRFDGIFLNTEVAPFDDPSVRQALAWAIDRQGLIDAAYGGDADLGNDVTYFPDYAIQPEGLEQREQDLDQVAELLDGRTVEFTITTTNQLVGEALQQQLNEVPGFTVDLDVQTSAEYYGEGEPWLNAAVTVTNWASRTPSQYISLIFGAESEWNASHYSNPELEELSARFDASTDDAERQDLVDQIAEIQWNDLAVIVPAFVQSQLLLSNRVQGDFLGKIDFATGYPFSGISISE